MSIVWTCIVWLLYWY